MDEKPESHPVRSLVLFLTSGAAIFASGVFILLGFMARVGGVANDAPVMNFYPIMAGLGAVFGFER